MHSKRTWWPVLSGIALSALGLLAIALGSAGAQNLPPPGAYQPIPNFTGVGAGLQFRQAINDRMSGIQPILPMVVGPSFANLPAEQDGLLIYCKDCKRATPCIGGGSGAWARGNRGAWSCAIDALEASLNANGNKITSLANGTIAGDAISFGQPSGGDLSGSIPNPTVASVLGGKAPIYSGQTGARINTLAGAKGDGSDALSNFNVNGVFNVKAYNAKCDGSTDDWAAIQSAITAANTARTAAGAPTVYFPPTASACEISRPLVYASPSNVNMPALLGAGALATTLNTTFTGPAIVTVGQGPASFIKTSIGSNIIVGGSGNSLVFASGDADFFDLAEVNPTNISVQPYVGPYNGDTQWDIRFFFKPTDLSANRCWWGSTGAFNPVLNPSNSGNPTIGGTSGMGYFCTGSDGKPYGSLRVSGTPIAVAGSSALTVNTVYEVELNLDSSHNVNLYVGTGGTVTRVAQTASGGTAITQRADESNTLGQVFGSWPYNGTVGSAVGAIQSVQISNVARNTASSYTEDTANFVRDGNTLFLDNFDLNQFNGGVAVNPTAEVDAPVGGWMALHIGELGCCGGTYNVSGLNLSGAGLTVGVFADANAIDISHVTTTARMYGIEVSRTAGFNSFIHDITEQIGVADNAPVGIMALGGIIFIKNIISNAGMFPIYTNGYSVENVYEPGNTENLCGIAVEANNSPAVPIELSGLAFDSENGGTFPGVCISGSSPVEIRSSFLNPSNAAMVQLIGNVGQLTIQDSVLWGATGAEVDATYASRTAGASVIFDNDQFESGYKPSVPYTNQGFPYSTIGHTPRFHHLEIPVVPTPEVGAVNGQPLCISTTTCAYPVPHDAHVGDVEIAAPALEGGAPGTVTAPAGWTLACVADNSANGDWVGVYWHVVTPADTATYTWTSGNSQLWRGGVASFSGVNQLNPIDQCVTSTATTTTSISLTGTTSSDQNDIDVFLTDNSDIQGALSLPSPPAGVVQDFIGQGNTLTMWSYLPQSTTIPAITVNTTSASASFAGVQLLLAPALSQSSLLTAGEGSPPLYLGEPGAALQSLATNVPIEAANVVGTVTTNTTLSFAKQSVQDITTATTGLTYTLSTVGVTPNQDVMIRSHIAGSITGPLWATSSGAIKWAGGSAPTSSGTSGYTDILRLYFDGTNWQEVSRSIGNH